MSNLDKFIEDFIKMFWISETSKVSLVKRYSSRKMVSVKINGALFALDSKVYDLLDKKYKNDH